MDEVEIDKTTTKYEITVILQEKDSIEPVEKTIADSGSQVIKTTDLGIKQFAYPIKKLGGGHYFVVQFAASAENLKKLNDELKHEGSIIRFLVIKALRFPALRPPRKERVGETAKKTEETEKPQIVVEEVKTAPPTKAVKVVETEPSEKVEVAKPEIPEVKTEKPAVIKPEKKPVKAVKAKKTEKNVKISASELDKKLEELVED